MTPGREIADVERVMWVEIGPLAGAPGEPAELATALKQTRAQMAFGTETVTNQAFWLGFGEVLATYTWFETFLDRLSKVTAADIQRVANAYLTRDNVTVGSYFAQGGS